ncbi:helix-turn-helix domain-containing protein [Campylobacter concisus]|uniref:helix-turn-helix domain-containing protein n=1 Tax=Campylobacter concisus TaxID=199 RepID=UPI001883A1D5|nr:helix-turn-helix domain-containing protein [Campylobacter concisus]MBE9851616.1 helix-turn-helix domain-containing protein [Campylobacter concisus]
MSIRIMSQVWNMEIDDSTTKLTLMALADFSDDEGYCYPSYEVLAKKISKSKRTAIRAVEKLTELGFLQKEKRELKDGTSSANLYKILSENERVTQTHPRVTNEKERVTSMTLPSDTDDTPRVTSMSPCSDKGVTPINITTNRTVSRTVNEPSINPLPPKDISLPDFIDPNLWQDYLAYKKERKEKLSDKGIEMKFSEWAKWASEGIDVNACIREAMRNEWQGVFKPKPSYGAKVASSAQGISDNNPHGLKQGTLNTMAAFRELAREMRKNGKSDLVGDFQ